MTPAMVIRASRTMMTMAVAGRTCPQAYKHVEAPETGGLNYMKEGSVTVGRAGRLSVHTWDERALGMRVTESPPSCMPSHYRPHRVVT